MGDAKDDLKNGDIYRALMRLSLADQELAASGENQRLKVKVDNALQALSDNKTTKALTLLN